MEVYARELLPRLAVLDGLRLTAFVNREAAAAQGDAPWGALVPMQVVPVRARNRLEWVRGEQQYLPRMAAAAGCDLIHSLASTAPLRGRVPRVTTIHDLNYRKVPEAHFGVRGLGMRVLVPGAARRSRRLVVDAASTRDDLVTDLGVPSEKIDVVPLGVSVPTVADGCRCSRARAPGSGRSPARAQRVGQAPAQEPRAPAARAGRDPGRAPPAARGARLFDSPRARAARAGARAGRGGRRQLAAMGDRRRPGGPLRGRHLPGLSLPLRGLRSSRAGGDGARLAGGDLGPRGAARGRGRRGAALRPRERAADPGGDRAARGRSRGARAPGGARAPRGRGSSRGSERPSSRPPVTTGRSPQPDSVRVGSGGRERLRAGGPTAPRGARRPGAAGSSRTLPAGRAPSRAGGPARPTPGR